MFVYFEFHISLTEKSVEINQQIFPFDLEGLESRGIKSYLGKIEKIRILVAKWLKLHLESLKSVKDGVFSLQFRFILKIKRPSTQVSKYKLVKIFKAKILNRKVLHKPDL